MYQMIFTHMNACFSSSDFEIEDEIYNENSTTSQDESWRRTSTSQVVYDFAIIPKFTALVLSHLAKKVSLHSAQSCK